MLVAHNLLSADIVEDLDRDFPRYRGAGYLPYDAVDCGPRMISLVEEMMAPPFAAAIGERLGLPDLGQYPNMVTICRSLNHRHGNIHTDSNSKIATALLYLNPDWMQTSEGCLRFLEQGDDFEATVVPEIRPLYGTLAAFRRADNSWHGHLPFQGERRVIQIAWLTSEKEKLRKTKRGRMARILKAVTSTFSQRKRAA